MMPAGKTGSSIQHDCPLRTVRSAVNVEAGYDGLRAGLGPSLLTANDLRGMVVKIDAKKVLWWSFIAGIGFSLGGALITAPIHILNAWMKVTYFGG